MSHLDRLGPQQPGQREPYARRDTPLRGEGGRFGRRPPPPPAIPDVPPDPPRRSAVERLAELARLRQANAGLLIPKPPGIDGARLIFPSEGDIQDGIARESGGLRAAKAWLEAIAALGASPGDLDVAWHAWNPAGLGEHSPKLKVRNWFDDLRHRAGKAWAALLAEAAAEQRPAHQLQALRNALGQARHILAEADRRLDPLRRDVAAREAAVAAHLDKHPHLKEA